MHTHIPAHQTQCIHAHTINATWHTTHTHVLNKTLGLLIQSSLSDVSFVHLVQKDLATQTGPKLTLFKNQM